MQQPPTIVLPPYAKYAFLLIVFFGTGYLLVIGEGILAPIVYATLFAILLNPFVKFLEMHKVPRVLAITIVMLLAILLVTGLVVFITMQMRMFGESVPQLVKRFNEFLVMAETWVSTKFHVPMEKINIWVDDSEAKLLNSSGSYITQGLGTITGVLMIVFLLPVYIFMILYYRGLLFEFMMRVATTDRQEQVVEVLVETKGIIQGYLRGLMMEATIIAVLNSVALLILGVEYAILLGSIGAILNMIPWIGGVIATALPMIIALVTKSSLVYPLLVLLIYMVIQFIDNHLIIPKIVASRVKLNALVSLVVVFVGGALWGIPGMFLSIPITAIVKIIFDRVDSLKPFGYVLGNDMPPGSGAFSITALTNQMAGNIKRRAARSKKK